MLKDLIDIDVKAVVNTIKTFIEENNITAPETISQSDRVIVNAYEFIEELCDLVGYADSEEEKSALKAWWWDRGYEGADVIFASNRHDAATMMFKKWVDKYGNPQVDVKEIEENLKEQRLEPGVWIETAGDS